MVISIPYHPSPAQRRFHESQSDEVLFGGEIGSGKTTAVVMDNLIKMLQYPGVTPYIFRATYQQGEDTILQAMEQHYPKELGRFNKEDMTYYCISGSKARLRQCKTLEDAKKNDGKEFSILYIDEPQHLDRDAQDYLCTRVRANKKLGIKPQVKMSAMQGGKGHPWIKRTFIDPLEPNVPKAIKVHSDRTGVDYEITREFIPAATRENKNLDSGYMGRMEMRLEKHKRAMNYSDWNAIEGQAFPEWVDKPYDKDGKPTDKWTHVISAEAFGEIPAHWPIYRGYDYGRAKPYSFLWFTRGDETYNNRLFLIAELYGGTEDEEGLDEPASKQAEKALIIERPLIEKHGWIEGVADPSIFAKSAFADESIASVMEEHGIYFRDPRHDPEVAQNVINNRLQGKELIHELLIFDANGYPGFQVFDTCKNFRKHFPELVKDPKNPDDVNSDNTNDHDYDACRYVVVLTKPKVKMPVPISKKRRYNPLDTGERLYGNDDNGKVLTINIPNVVIGG